MHENKYIISAAFNKDTKNLCFSKGKITKKTEFFCYPRAELKVSTQRQGGNKGFPRGPEGCLGEMEEEGERRGG